MAAKTHMNKPWDWGTAFCGLKGDNIELAVDFEDDVADPCKRCEKAAETFKYKSEMADRGHFTN